MTGTFVDAGLAIWRASGGGYQEAGNRVVETVDELTQKGQGVRDDVVDVVARGAHEVERYAVGAKSHAAV